MKPCRPGASLALGVALALAGCGGSGSGAGGSGAPDETTVELPASVVDRYLTRRPALGAAIVVDVSAESEDRKLLAATLQGQANRDVARVYLIGTAFDGPEVDRAWIDRYAAEGRVRVEARVDLDAALDRFARELTGYVMADAAEPWTLNAATTVVATDGGVVATPTTVAALEARGLTMLDDLRGRWPDAITCYRDMVATYRTRLAYDGLAIQSLAQHGMRDFYVQQQVLTVYTRPGDDDFEDVYRLMDAFGSEGPVYGYVADNGSQEATALFALSRKGRFLVPSSTMNNVSFHVAVDADRPRVRPGRFAPDAPAADPCDAHAVNVVLAVSDGDNIRVPLATYDREQWWLSAERATLPFGFSIGTQVAVLMPAVWDHYAREADARSEIVSMVGMGYTLPSLWPDPRDFYVPSLELDALLGLDVSWSLDLPLHLLHGWAFGAVEDGMAEAGHAPAAFLINYQDRGGPTSYYTPTGVPVLASQQGGYGDDGAALREQIEALLATPAARRPPVTFFAITVWGASVEGLVDALTPLEERGVRFLSPSEGAACMRAARDG